MRTARSQRSYARRDPYKLPSSQGERAARCAACCLDRRSRCASALGPDRSPPRRPRGPTRASRAREAIARARGEVGRRPRGVPGARAVRGHAPRGVAGETATTAAALARDRPGGVGAPRLPRARRRGHLQQRGVRRRTARVVQRPPCKLQLVDYPPFDEGRALRGRRRACGRLHGRAGPLWPRRCHLQRRLATGAALSGSRAADGAQVLLMLRVQRATMMSRRPSPTGASSRASTRACQFACWVVFGGTGNSAASAKPHVALGRLASSSRPQRGGRSAGASAAARAKSLTVAEDRSRGGGAQRRAQLRLPTAAAGPELPARAELGSGASRRG